VPAYWRAIGTEPFERSDRAALLGNPARSRVKRTSSSSEVTVSVEGFKIGRSRGPGEEGSEHTERWRTTQFRPPEPHCASWRVNTCKHIYTVYLESPLKRLLDTWDRNGSTSGPTPWQIDDDDDDLEYVYTGTSQFCGLALLQDRLAHTGIRTSGLFRHTERTWIDLSYGRTNSSFQLLCLESLSIAEIHKWIWSTCAVVVTEETRSTRRQTCPSATLSTAWYRTWTSAGSDRHLTEWAVGRPATAVGLQDYTAEINKELCCLANCRRVNIYVAFTGSCFTV
jgi:hypothetical protein